MSMQSEDESAATLREEQAAERVGCGRTRRCGDCCAEVGALHVPGCDIERCALCGGQVIACSCAWDLSDVGYDRRDELGSPTDEMWVKYSRRQGTGGGAREGRRTVLRGFYAK